MKDVVLNEVNLFYIQEDIYQNIKKQMRKDDNYFDEKEIKKLRLNYAQYKSKGLPKNEQSLENTLERVVGIEPTLSGRKVYF